MRILLRWSHTALVVVKVLLEVLSLVLILVSHRSLTCLVEDALL